MFSTSSSSSAGSTASPPKPPASAPSTGPPAWKSPIPSKRKHRSFPRACSKKSNSSPRCSTTPASSSWTSPSAASIPSTPRSFRTLFSISSRRAKPSSSLRTAWTRSKSSAIPSASSTTATPSSAATCARSRAATSAIASLSSSKAAPTSSNPTKSPPPTTTPATPKSRSSLTATRKSSFTSPPLWPPFTVSNSSSLHSRKSSSRLSEASPMPNSPRNMLLVAKREYLEQIRGRAFIFSTVLLPLLIVGGMAASYFFGRKAGTGAHIAIVAQNVSLANQVRREMLYDTYAKYTVDVVTPASPDNRAALLQQLHAKSIDGILSIESSSSAAITATYTSLASVGFANIGAMQDQLNRGIVNQRLDRK